MLGFTGNSTGKQAIDDWLTSSQTDLGSRIYKACNSIDQTRAVSIDNLGMGFLEFNQTKTREGKLLGVF